ncbi:Tetratricopeptide repeat family protein [Polaribacter irgensii 23-P]|uniref:Tetratricopeptide repeat family protein n=1 Tax=Polaribacter irgensii 23-P TaxID=313594 RepID=A4BZD8_9FLAO|nr:tetratricopeptide repeat protein [Polaribacter irgensii]EAR12531.1 Tetratricopeptide repeat family protein [Polaribacter irgensii 23-P]
MKNQVLALSLGLLTAITFGQKKELKVAEKALRKSEFSSALAAVNSVEGMLESMDSKYKSKYYFLKAQVFLGQNKYQEASNAFTELFEYEKEIDEDKYSEDAKPMLNDLIQKVSGKSIEQYNAKDYAGAQVNFYLTYKLSPKDTSFLYNAAISASLSKEYDVSLKFYKELKTIGYTGVNTQYFATDKETGIEEEFGSKGQRDIMIKSGGYTVPLDKVSESKQAEIVKNIGYILVNQGKTEEAVIALQEARKANPKDVNLILNEAQLYIKLEKMDKFAELMKEAVKLDPTNPTLFFNLGVVNSNEGKIEDAVGYYKKAIELDPEYGDAYMNLAIAMLGKEKALVEEMNKNLSNFKKYDALQAEQKELYKSALPFLMKADSIKRSLQTVKTLLNIYDTLRMEKEAAILRPIYKELRG